MNYALLVKDLAEAGFVIGQRDERLNQAFKGRFMVAIGDYSEQELPTEDASCVPCVVGDDLYELIQTAHATFCP